ncbi:hypothetical protein A6J63_022850 [Yersinia enterocolitica]|nr:hypothetical protein A6J63_022850 [Yersinia enterocolitica]
MTGVNEGSQRTCNLKYDGYCRLTISLVLAQYSRTPASVLRDPHKITINKLAPYFGRLWQGD